MKYWIIMNGVQLGPVEAGELRALNITRDTPVWREGMQEWMKAGQVAELAGMFSQGPAVPPPSGAYHTNVQPQYAPGSRFNGPEIPQEPPTYLVWSILVTIFCCLPFGIVAIIYSAQVSSAYNQGNYEQAQRYSKTAMNWIIASAVCGVVMMGLSMMMWFPLAIAGAAL